MIDEFKTISDTIGEGYYTEKRSKFLAFAHHVTTVDEVKEIVAGYRKKYYDARHCCYAYMLGPERTEFRANDDGAGFFLFWAVRQDFTRILRAKCRFLIFVRKPQRHRKKFETF